MSWCPGEDARLSRELDLYDLAFLTWLGYSEHTALARLQLHPRSVQRWRKDPGKFLPEDAETRPFYTVPGGEYIPRDQEESSLAS